MLRVVQISMSLLWEALAAPDGAPKQEYHFMVHLAQHQLLDGRRAAASLLQKAALFGCRGECWEMIGGGKACELVA